MENQQLIQQLKVFVTEYQCRREPVPGICSLTFIYAVWNGQVHTYTHKYNNQLYTVSCDWYYRELDTDSFTLTGRISAKLKGCF